MTKNSIIKYWQNVRALTLDLLGKFPDDQMSYRPATGVRSVGAQFDHILAVELYIRKGITENIWGPTPTPGLGITQKTDLYGALGREHQETTSVLHMLPESAFEAIYQTKFGKVSGEGLVYLGIDEEIHHRGNLYVYLRMLGITAPQMVHNYYQLFMEEQDDR
jgi:uncharacterized damage-inducible protein DinB